MLAIVFLRYPKCIGKMLILALDVEGISTIEVHVAMTIGIATFPIDYP